MWYCQVAIVWAMVELDYEFSLEIPINKEKRWGQAQLNARAHYIRADCIDSTQLQTRQRQPWSIDHLING